MGDEVTKNEPRTECFPSTHEGFLSTSDDEQWVHEDDDEDIYL